MQRCAIGLVSLFYGFGLVLRKCIDLIGMEICISLGSVSTKIVKVGFLCGGSLPNLPSKVSSYQNKHYLPILSRSSSDYQNSYIG